LLPPTCQNAGAEHLFSVHAIDVTEPAFGLKKEALPKFNHLNASKVWLHPTERAGGLGMDPYHSSQVNVSCSQLVLNTGFIWMRFTDGSVFGYSPMLWLRIRITGSLLQMIDASSVQHAQRLDFTCNKKN
jgi:hypothetical protein